MTAFDRNVEIQPMRRRPITTVDDGSGERERRRVRRCLVRPESGRADEWCDHSSRDRSDRRARANDKVLRGAEQRIHEKRRERRIEPVLHRDADDRRVRQALRDKERPHRQPRYGIGHQPPTLVSRQPPDDREVLLQHAPLLPVADAPGRAHRATIHPRSPRIGAVDASRVCARARERTTEAFRTPPRPRPGSITLITARGWPPSARSVPRVRALARDGCGPGHRTTGVCRMRMLRFKTPAFGSLTVSTRPSRSGRGGSPSHRPSCGLPGMAGTHGSCCKRLARSGTASTGGTT